MSNDKKLKKKLTNISFGMINPWALQLFTSVVCLEGSSFCICFTYNVFVLSPDVLSSGVVFSGVELNTQHTQNQRISEQVGCGPPCFLGV